MGHRITHACGHEQIHVLSGYASQQERKAKWLRTTNCQTCFVAEKHFVQGSAAAADGAAIAHLDLAPLVGSDRQAAWATTIRAKRVAAMLRNEPASRLDHSACLRIGNAKWWIDHRDLSDAQLAQQAEAGCAQETSSDDLNGGPMPHAPCRLKATALAKICCRQAHDDGR
jgi:hypothetical protein